MVDIKEEQENNQEHLIKLVAKEDDKKDVTQEVSAEKENNSEITQKGFKADGESGDQQKSTQKYENKEKEEDDEWLDILDNKQILKKVIKEGNKNHARPEKGCRVKINLTTRLKETRDLIESESFEDKEIFVGDCDINHALDLVVPLMNEGEIANVIVAPRFAYGEKGNEPDVPPNATLDLTVELISIDWIEELTEIKAQERIEIGQNKKERGNFFFTRGEYSNSVMLYKRAVEFLEIDPTELNEDVDKLFLDKIMELKASTYNNLAQAQMKMEAFDAALASVNNALAINEKNVKALFRKGKILATKGDLQEALEIYRAASKLDPDNRLIKIELSATAKARQKQLADEKTMFKRMLQLDDDKTTAKTSAPSSSNSEKTSFLKKWYNPKTLIIVVSLGVALVGAATYQVYN